MTDQEDQALAISAKVAGAITAFKLQKIYSRAFNASLVELLNTTKITKKELYTIIHSIDPEFCRLYTTRIIDSGLNYSYIWFATQPAQSEEYQNKETTTQWVYVEKPKPKIESNTSVDYFVEKYSLDDYNSNQMTAHITTHMTATELRELGAMSGYTYINEPSRRKYKHMRAMLINHWAYNKTPASEQFDVDTRLQYKEDDIALWLNTNLTVFEINSAHDRVREQYSSGNAPKRGRPPGARNKNKVQIKVIPSKLEEMLDDIDTDPEEVKEFFNKPDEATPNILETTNTNLPSINLEQTMTLLNEALRQYVTHSDLNRRDYTTKQNLIDASVAIQKAIEEYVTNEIASVKANKPTIVEIKQLTGEIKALGIQHKHFVELLSMVQARVSGNRPNIWLYGPPGTGKTTAAKIVASALGLPFYLQSNLETGFQVLGYKDANGTYQGTMFRQAWEHGGVMMLDEIDGFQPGAALALNGALANGVCSFPDGMVARHKDCCIIAGANTTGLGGGTEYVGRNRLDAATLDRFLMLDWPLDEALEAALCPIESWLYIVRTVRYNVQSRAFKNVMITPRAAIFGCSMLQAGLSIERTMASVLKKGMTDAQWQQVKPSNEVIAVLQEYLDGLINQDQQA